jgi:WD40 repeat protein
MTYHAFISYSHAADGKLAPALQRALHRFGKPLFKLRALHVFRDKESLSANPALWPSIEKALSESEHFLLLASPGSARSPWVVREVEWWLANRPAAKHLIVVTDGDLVWSPGAADFDWDKTTALPKVVAGRFTDEPLWVDLRWAKTASDLSLQHSQFRAAVLDLAAPLHGRPKEELDSEDVRQYRKTRRIRRSAVAVLAALTMTAVMLALYAIRQRDEATRQRDAALSRQAGAQALRVIDARLDTALILAVEASRRADTFDARNALLTSLLRAPSLAFFLPGHRTSVTATALSPDGSLVVSGSSDDGVVMFWDVARRQALGEPVAAHQNGVTEIAFSADGRLLASAGRDGTVQLWDAATRQRLGPLMNGHRVQVSALAFSKNGRMLASGDAAGSILLWNASERAADGAPLQAEQRNAITALAFDDRGTTLASADGFGSVMLWNLETPERKGVSFFDGQFSVQRLTFSPDRQATAIGLSNADLIRWTVGQGRAQVHPVTTGTDRTFQSLDTRALAFNAPGQMAVLATPEGEMLPVHLADAADRQPLIAKAMLMDLRRGLLTVALSANGNRLVSGYRDGALVVWDLALQHPLARPLLGSHKADVTAVAFGPQGKTLVSAAADGTLIRWDTDTLRPIGAPLEGHTSPVGTAAVSRNGDLIASGDGNGAVFLWDVTGHRAAGPPLRGHGGQVVNRVAFSPDGTLLATGGRDRRLVLWDVGTRQALGTLFEDPTWSITGAAFSPDGRVLVSGTVNGDITLWDVGRRQVLGGPVSAGKNSSDHFAFRGDGRLLVSQGNIVLNVWDVADGRRLGTRKTLDPIDPERRQGQGGGLAMNPEGTLIVTGGNNRLVLWDVASGQPLERVLWGWQGVNTRVAMSPDGHVVAASHGEGVVLWDVGMASWQRRACQVANRDLTQQEWDKFVGPELPYRRTCTELGAPR